MVLTYQQLVDEARARVQAIGVDEVARWQREGKAFVLIDVREDREWEGGHAAGAVHCGRGVLEKEAPKLVPDPQATVVVMCGGGGRCVLGADTLQRMGYADVRVMEAGLKGWVGAGQPVER